MSVLLYQGLCHPFPWINYSETFLPYKQEQTKVPRKVSALFNVIFITSTWVHAGYSLNTATLFI